TRCYRDWSSDVCSSDLDLCAVLFGLRQPLRQRFGVVVQNLDLGGYHLFGVLGVVPCVPTDAQRQKRYCGQYHHCACQPTRRAFSHRGNFIAFLKHSPSPFALTLAPLTEARPAPNDPEWDVFPNTLISQGLEVCPSTHDSPPAVCLPVIFTRGVALWSTCSLG